MKYTKKLTDRGFTLMSLVMRIMDVTGYVPSTAELYGIETGMTVVDYGCGPGRFTVEFARLAGSQGKVYAVDIIGIALSETQKRLEKAGAGNVELRLAQGYDSGVPQGAADIVCAIDMFHHVEAAPFLVEVSRITKPDGVLVIAGGHQPRGSVKADVSSSGLWELTKETRRYLKYRKIREVER